MLVQPLPSLLRERPQPDRPPAEHMAQFHWPRLGQPGTRQPGQQLVGGRPRAQAQQAGQHVGRQIGTAVECRQGRHRLGPDPHQPSSSPENASDCSGPAFGAAVGPTSRRGRLRRVRGPRVRFGREAPSRGTLVPATIRSTAGPPCSVGGVVVASSGASAPVVGQPDQRGPCMRSRAVCRSRSTSTASRP